MLCGALAMTVAACSGDLITDDVKSIDSSNDERNLTISIGAPKSGSVTTSSRATVEAEPDESVIDYVDIYIFDTDAAASTDNNDYKFYGKYSFGTRPGDDKMVDESNGRKLCSIPIEESMLEKNVKIAVVANEPISMSLIEGTTTLSAFLGAQASANVQDYDYCDNLVGGTDNKSFPMTYITENIELTNLGAKVNAELVRNVARIDIFNYTPNLIITNIAFDHVNSKSLVFSQPTVSDPQGSSKIALLPLQEFTAAKVNDGIPYNKPDDDTEASARKLNTYRAGYFYEQEVTDEASSPMITITYKLSVEDEMKYGSLVIRFKKGDNFINVDRNTLYRIRLGNGRSVGASQIAVRFEVLDWEEGATITTIANTDEDSPVSLDYDNNYADAQLGDIMLVHDGNYKIVTPEVYASIPANEQKNAVGVVAFLYKNHPASLRTGGDIYGKLGSNATGIVMALNNANSGLIHWKTSSTQSGTLMANHKSAYDSGEDGLTLTNKYANAAHPAFTAAKNYNTSHPTAATTTAWYLPSIAEWFDILGTTGIGNSAHADWYKTNTGSNSGIPDDIKETTASLVGKLNACLAKVGSGSYTPIGTGDESPYTFAYWSATEGSVTHAHNMLFYNKGWFIGLDNKASLNFQVRPFLAF